MRWLALLALLLPSTVAAQSTVPNFSHGLSASAFSIHFQRFQDGAIDAKFGMLAEGIGYSFNLNNLVSSEDGTMSWLGFKFPVYPQVFDSEFALALGGEVSFFNNLLGIGFAVDAVNTATDRGFILGEVDAEDCMVTFSLGFNLGAGNPPPVTGAASLSQARSIQYETKPPFNFVSLRR